MKRGRKPKTPKKNTLNLNLDTSGYEPQDEEIEQPVEQPVEKPFEKSVVEVDTSSLSLRELIQRNDIGKPMSSTPKTTNSFQMSTNFLNLNTDILDEAPSETPQIQIVDGQIVFGSGGGLVDNIISGGPTSTNVSDILSTNFSEVSENKHIYSSRFARKNPEKQTERWTKDETLQFYQALQQFGTDFSLIETQFPHRTRRQIKLKFKKEEREHPHRIDAALRSPIPIKKHHYEKISESLPKSTLPIPDTTTTTSLSNDTDQLLQSILNPSSTNSNKSTTTTNSNAKITQTTPKNKQSTTKDPLSELLKGTFGINFEFIDDEGAEMLHEQDQDEQEQENAE